MLDVDYFKAINDAHGHLAGDEVLIELCRRLRAVMRREEILARYGGEEFAILLSETTLAEAQVFAERLRDSIAGVPLSTTHGEIPVTISIGIAALGATEPSTAGELLNAADRNLYAAKNAGRNCVIG
jgi:diguanylate cyclase (GGDEF)-like protein